MIEGYSDNTLDLVPGTIKGFRMFFTLAAPITSQSLRSLTVQYLWNESDWNHSRCYRFGVQMDNAHRIRKNCSCGFYACHSVETLIDQGYYADTVGGVAYYNLGFVEASGTVFLGPKGFRAERMRIIDLIPNPSYSEAMNFQYSHPTSSIEELLKR